MDGKKKSERLKGALVNVKPQNKLARNPMNSSVNMNVGAAAFILNSLSKLGKVEDEASSKEQIKRDGITTEVAESYQNAAKKRWIRAIIIHITLIIALIGYSFIGAAIFQALEGGVPKEIVVDLEAAKSNLLEQIWEENKNQTSKAKWLEDVDKLLTEYDKKVANVINLGIDIEDKGKHRQNITDPAIQHWDLWSSLFFAGTVYTTIGYGHLAPITTGGKIATMIYAVIGIPLCLTVLADMGGLFSEFLKFIMRACKRCCCRSKNKVEGKWSSQEDAENLSGKSVVACLVIIIIVYLFVGAALYIIWEDKWTYLDSFYFMFISFR